jgi:hypothetical protein
MSEENYIFGIFIICALCGILAGQPDQQKYRKRERCMQNFCWKAKKERPIIRPLSL